METKRRTFYVTLPEDIYNALERRRYLEKKKSTSDLIGEALEVFLFLDRSLTHNAEKIAEIFNVTTGDVISNSAIAFIALAEATIEILGPKMDLLRKIFISEKDEDEDIPKLITGTNLFENLKRNYVNRLREELKDASKN
jgi:hypothetical protein